MNLRKMPDPFRVGGSVAIIIDSQLRLGYIERVVQAPAKSNKLPSIWVKLDGEGKVFSRRQNEVAPLDPHIHREIQEAEAVAPSNEQEPRA